MKNKEEDFLGLSFKNTGCIDYLFGLGFRFKLENKCFRIVIFNSFFDLTARQRDSYLQFGKKLDLHVTDWIDLLPLHQRLWLKIMVIVAKAVLIDIFQRSFFAKRLETKLKVYIVVDL